MKKASQLYTGTTSEPIIQYENSTYQGNVFSTFEIIGSKEIRNQKLESNWRPPISFSFLLLLLNPLSLSPLSPVHPQAIFCIKEICLIYNYSKNNFIRIYVRPSFRLSVRVLNFEVPFKRLFAPTSCSRMSNIVRDSESLGKSNEKKMSQI